MLLSKLFRNSNFSNIKRIIFYYKGKIDAARVFYHLFCVEFPSVLKIERFRVKVELLTLRGYLKLTSLLGGRGFGGGANLQHYATGFGYDLFGRVWRTVAAQSKTFSFTTNKTDFFDERVLCY